MHSFSGQNPRNLCSFHCVCEPLRQKDHFLFLIYVGIIVVD